MVIWDRTVRTGRQMTFLSFESGYITTALAVCI